MLPLPVGWNAGWRAECLNRMHAPLMGICCVALEALFRPGGGSNKLSLFLATLSACVMAALVELVQPWFHRTADLRDFMWDLAGIAAGSFWNNAALLQSIRLRVIMRVVAVAGLLSPPFAWTAQVLMARHAADGRFPVLTDFTGYSGDFFWSMEPVLDSGSYQPKPSAHMILERTGQKPASAHLDALNRDWTPFDRLEIDGTLEASAAVEVGVRLDLNSAAGPRLCAGGWMMPGRHCIQIQWPNSDQTQHVHQLVVFLSAGEPAASLQIHRLHLVPRKDLNESAPPRAGHQ